MIPRSRDINTHTQNHSFSKILIKVLPWIILLILYSCTHIQLSLIFIHISKFDTKMSHIKMVHIISFRIVNINFLVQLNNIQQFSLWEDVNSSLFLKIFIFLLLRDNSSRLLFFSIVVDSNECFKFSILTLDESLRKITGFTRLLIV